MNVLIYTPHFDNRKKAAKIQLKLVLYQQKCIDRNLRKIDS
jgi:hypothetical protein